MPCPACSTLALADAYAGRLWQTGYCRLWQADWQQASAGCGKQTGNKQTSKTVVSTWMRTTETRIRQADKQDCGFDLDEDD